MDGFRVVCNFCDVAVVGVSKIFKNECVDSFRVNGNRAFKEGKKHRDVCGAAERVEDEFFPMVCGVAFSTRIRLFKVPVLGEPSDFSYELDGG